MKGITIAIIGILFLAGCDKENKDINLNTEFPAIDSITTSSYQVKAGSKDPAILNCYATGGNLNYVWEVDLGDLFPLNDKGSEVQFTASPCCLGEKSISCMVSNDKGSVSKNITITIIQ